MGLQAFNETVPLVPAYSFTNAYVANTKENLFSTQPGNWRVDTLQATNTDAAAHTLSIWLVLAGTAVLVATVTVGAGAGTGAVPPVDILGQIQPANYHYLVGTNAYTVQVSLEAAPAGTSVVNVLGQGGGV